MHQVSISAGHATVVKQTEQLLNHYADLQWQVNTGVCRISKRCALQLSNKPGCSEYYTKLALSLGPGTEGQDA